ncbi:MAG: hypothetical protein U1F61_06545 [Opitutaceae bacterium]
MTSHHSLIFLLFSWLLFLAYPAGAQERILSLSGDTWQIKDEPVNASAFCTDWLPVRVPGNVQADLESARMLRPLWYGAGDARLYEVAKRDWHYRRDFMVPTDFVGKRVRLVFDGVDNECEVWLNGHRLGSNRSMFTRFEFEVADKLRVGDANRLEVRLKGIPEDLIPYIEKSDGQSLGVDAKWRFTNGMQATVDSLREMKSGTNFGYDWGVNIWTLGIWKDVWLNASGPAVVRYLKIETPLSEGYSKAKVMITGAIDSQAAGSASLRLRIRGHGPDRTIVQALTLTSGANAVRAEIPLDDAALWWPNGHGAQNLYTLEATLSDGAGRISHTWSSRFGVREIRWEPTADAPAGFAEKYLPVVNGRPIRMLGSNLIPPDLLFARIPERAPHLLRLARDAGFNTLRLWGGGVLYDRAVFDLADELGLMLMLEIYMANIDPGPNPELLKNLGQTLPNIIRQVWNHPSIVEYTGGNEMSYGRSGDYTVIRHIRKMFDDVDPSRLFRDTDPADGSTHGSWNYPLKPSDPVDPIQVYTAWNALEPRVTAAEPFAHIARPNFSRGIFYIKGKVPDDWRFSMRYGEYGYQTPAHLEVWQRDIPRASQWPLSKEDPVLIRKNVFHAIAVFDDETWLEKPVIEHLFGPAPDLAYLLKAGQYVGAEGLRYATDAIRRRGPATGAMLTWDFNEPWTNGAGSYLVDHDGRPLMNYAFLKQAVTPLALSLRHDSALYDLQDGIRTTLYLCSDAAVRTEGLKWSWCVRDRRGAVVASGEGSATIDPLEVKKLADVAVALPERTAFGPFLVELHLKDGQGRHLQERVHAFGLRGVRAPLRGMLDGALLDPDDVPAQLQPLLAASSKTGTPRLETVRPFRRTRLEVTAEGARIEAGQEILKLAVTNTGPMTALFVEPQPILAYRTDLNIDNLFVSLPPGETRGITIRAPAHPRGGLSLNQTGWRITSWNADPVVLEPATEIVMAVGRADRMNREFADQPAQAADGQPRVVRVQGRRPDPGLIPFLMTQGQVVEFVFAATREGEGRNAVLRIHSADQSRIGARLHVELNGKSLEAMVPEGYAWQQSDRGHLGAACCTEIILPSGGLKSGENLLRVQVLGGGWFTWDSADLCVTTL